MFTGHGRERLVIQRNNAAASVSTLTRSATTATVTTASAHGFATGDYVTIAGATPAGYNGKKQITVTGATTFTFTASSGLASPATGTMTATYTSDAQLGRKISWSTVATVPAELVPVSTSEQLQAHAVRATAMLRFRIRSRADVTAQMRALWTPVWPPAAAQRTLEIFGVLPEGDGRVAMFLDCGVAT